MSTWPKVVPKKCEWPSLASELTAADVRGSHSRTAKMRTVSFTRNSNTKG